MKRPILVIGGSPAPNDEVEFSKEQIEGYRLATEICFGLQRSISQQETKEAEALLVFGDLTRSCERMAARMAWRMTGPNLKKIYVIGDAWDMKDFPNVPIVGIDKCGCLRDDIEGTMRRGFGSFSHVAFVSEAHLCGFRGLLLRVFLLATVVVDELGYSASLPNVPGIIERQYWHNESNQRREVLIQLTKIRLFGNAGAIHYPEEIRKMVNQACNFLGI